MTRKRQWDCWVLCQEDIEQLAVRMGHDPVHFNKADFEQIAAYFKDGLGWSYDDWPEVLEGAIKRHIQRSDELQEVDHD